MKKIKFFVGIIAIASFLCFLGIIGSVENDSLSFVAGAAQGTIYLTVFGLSIVVNKELDKKIQARWRKQVKLQRYGQDKGRAA